MADQLPKSESPNRPIVYSNTVNYGLLSSPRSASDRSNPVTGTKGTGGNKQRLNQKPPSTPNGKCAMANWCN